MSVFTKNNRFQVDNQTHYNTDDLVRLLDFIVDKEIEAKAANERFGSWVRVPPEGAVIQFVEFTGRARHTRTPKSSESGGWEWVDKRLYVLPKDEKLWHVIKIIPPSAIYLNELEALSADMTKMPVEMAHQLVMRLLDLTQLNVEFEHDDFPAGLADVEVRIETTRQAKRKGVLRRPEKLYELREKERGLAGLVSEAAYKTSWAALRIDEVTKEREKLGLPELTSCAVRISTLHESLRLVHEELSAIFDKTPTA